MSERTRTRDDFSAATKEKLAKRVSYFCSKPDCRKVTVGAASTEEGTVNIGVAAHIKAASPDGKRYDPSMTSEERKAVTNGVWLCQDHAKLIDSDESQYTVEVLHRWKKTAEERSMVELALGRVRPQEHVAVNDQDVRSAFDLALRSCKADAQAFQRLPAWPTHAIELNLRLINEESKQDLTVSGLVSAIDRFNEIGVVAPPGTGKTTTLLQIVDAVVSSAVVAPIYVPLSEWATDNDSFVRSILKRPNFQNLREEQLNLLASRGHLGLVLDGWNELDEASKKRARTDIRSLRRNFPEFVIIVSSRSGNGDLPIDGPIVEIGTLDEAQQVNLAKAVRPNDGESILEHARRTPGLRELIAIPLYLTVLLRRTAGGSLPNTKEEVLRFFVESAECEPEKQATLRETMQGRHRDLLEAVAVKATQQRVTALSDSQARVVVNQAQDILKKENQIAMTLEPMKIIDTLVSSHLLVRSSSGALSFQHQQFQEWFASFYVERSIGASFAGGAGEKVTLREKILNVPSWQEPILFACERMSFESQDSAKAVASASVHTLGIDPMLSAEMIFRSSENAWEYMKEAIISFARKWHSPGKVDRAFRFMVATGRKEFSDYVWPLISSSDSQVHLHALRAIHPFRPSVLGPKTQKKIAELSEDVRTNVVSEIASNGGIDGMRLAASLAISDPSVKVKQSTIESLVFRRADRLVTQILDTAPDEVWSHLAERWHPNEFADPKVAARIEKEASKIQGEMNDPIRILNAILRSNVHEPEKAGTIQELIEKLDFQKGSQDAQWLVSRVHQLYPDAVAAAMVTNLEQGKPVPHLAEEILATSNIVVESGPIVEQVVRGDKTDCTAAATIVGAKTVGLMVDQLFGIYRKIKENGKYDEVLSNEYHALIGRISKTEVSAFAEALTSRAKNREPSGIAILAELIARHGRSDDRGPIKFRIEDREQTIEIVKDWAKTLLASPTATREEFADIAKAAERLNSQQLVPMLLDLLSEDLKRWKQAKEEFRRARQERRDYTGDAQMSWMEQYKRALGAIGGDQTVDAMKAYLRDSEFGPEAAIVLKTIWRHAQPSSGESRIFGSSPDFSVVPDAYSRRQSEAAGESHPFVSAILKEVNTLIKPGATESENLHAIKLATVAFGMPYVGCEDVISGLMRLPTSLSRKRELMTVLALSGQTLLSDLVLKGIDELLADAKSKTWLMDQNGWRLKEWLKLLAFTEKPSAVLDVLKRAEGFDTSPWNLREVLFALAYSPSSEAETALDELAKRDNRLVHEYDWSVALLRRGTLTAAKIFLSQIVSNFRPGGDRGGLDKTLSTLIASQESFREDVYEQYETLSDGPSRSLIEHAIAEVANIDGILLLLRVAAVAKRPFNSTSIRWAIEHSLWDRSSMETKVNEVEATNLRKQLFALAAKGNAEESQLAKKSLVVVDDILDEYGRQEIAFRHPDISTGLPWPKVEDNGA